MNSIKAKIVDIQSTQSLSLVSLEANKLHFKSIVIDTPNTCDYLSLDEEINMIFKEMEVSIATETNLPLSSQNQIPGKIVSLQKGKLLTKVKLHSSLGEISAVITTDSAKRLGLKLGQEVFALVKTNELMLSRI